MTTMHVIYTYIPDSFVNLNKRNGEHACVTRQTILIVNYQKKAEDEQHWPVHEQKLCLILKSSILCRYTRRRSSLFIIWMVNSQSPGIVVKE
jgi:hypothetical protein